VSLELEVKQAKKTSISKKRDQKPCDMGSKVRERIKKSAIIKIGTVIPFTKLLVSGNKSVLGMEAVR
jgi:hypothetical protein